VRTTLLTGVIRCGALGLAFVASLLYARALGPTEYGRYAYVLAWTALLTVPASLGLPQYLIREGTKATGQVRSLRAWADHRVLVAGLACGGLMVGLSLFPGNADASQLMLLAMILPLLNALAGVRSGLLQARARIIASQWPNLLLAPTLILIALISLWLISGQLSAEMLVLVTVLAALVPLAINHWQLTRSAAQPDAAGPHSADLKAALPFMWLNALFLINSRTDLIMVGALRGAHDAGIYSVASRAAELVAFFLTVTNTIIGPHIARMHLTKEHGRLQHLASETARRLLLVTLPIACVMLIGAPYLVRVFYGAGFADAAIVLQVLAIGQLMTVVFGPVGILLNMTEYASLSAKAFGISAMINVLFNVLLIPSLGSVGAAISTACSLTLCAAMRWWFVRRYLDLRPSALGI
jgi:O-antigen/teichoic acid export membrane protein